MAYGDFKDLPRRTSSDKILRDIASNIAKIWKYNGYQRVLDSMIYKYFDKKLTLLAYSDTLATREKSASGSGVKSEIISNQELAE